MQKLHSLIAMALATVVAGGMSSTQAQAGEAVAGAPKQATSLRRAVTASQENPAAPVFVVTSRENYGLLKDLARNANAKFDRAGRPLMLSEIRESQLKEFSQRIHVTKRQCGGYFAFATREAAEAFIRSDRSDLGMRKALAPVYTIDNQTTVNPWLPAVSETNIYNTIKTLSAYQNRYYTSSTGKSSAESIRNSWQQLANGRSDVTSELFTACSSCSTQPSVILTIRGAELPNEVVVLGAHLDSINISAGGSTSQVAPGADDDASGIATLTEVLRIAMASGWKPKRTVKFMGYAAEEVGLRGSNAIAQSYKTAGTNVVAVLQMDMTNYKPTGGADMRLETDNSNEDTKTFLVNLFDTYLKPLGLTRGTDTCGYACSDHASWTSAGFPAAMMFEGGGANGDYFNKIHTTGDTLANMGNSAANSAKFAKFGLAFLGEAAKTAGGGGNAPPSANFTFSTSALTATFTDGSSDSDGTIASRSWDFGDGVTSTAVNPSHTYAAGGTYTVKLTVTDNGGASSTVSKSVVVSGGGGACGGTVLCNGTAVALPSGAAKTWSSIYTIDVPAGKTSVVFNISGGSGDADLYVRLGSAPTTASYNCRPYLSGNNETCTLNAPAPGKYYVGVYAYAAYSGVSLKATISP